MTTHGCSYRGSFLVEVDVLSKGLPNWKLAMAMPPCKDHFIQNTLQFFIPISSQSPPSSMTLLFANGGTLWLTDLCDLRGQAWSERLSDSVTAFLHRADFSSTDSQIACTSSEWKQVQLLKGDVWWRLEHPPRALHGIADLFEFKFKIMQEQMAE